jgi:hypothetical protein
MIYIQALSFSFGDLKGWYNGYYAPDGARLYNPWSVGNALATGNLRSYWVESGNKFSYQFFFAMLKLIIPSPGYDRVIQKRIYHFLDTDNRFREQIADLLANKGTKIGIEKEMSYSFVTYIPYVLLQC